MAARITDAIGVPVQLVSGRRGEFSVRVGERVVAQKTSAGFPDEDAAVEAVRAALGQATA